MTTTYNDPLIAEIEKRIRELACGPQIVSQTAPRAAAMRELTKVLELVKQDRQRQQAEKEKMIRQLDGYAFPRNDEGRECVWLDRAVSIIQGKEQEERSEKE